MTLEDFIRSLYGAVVICIRVRFHTAIFVADFARAMLFSLNLSWVLGSDDSQNGEKIGRKQQILITI